MGPQLGLMPTPRPKIKNVFSVRPCPKNIYFCGALVGGPWGTHGGFYVDQWWSHEAPNRTPGASRETYGTTTPSHKQKSISFSGPGRLEFNFGQIAPSLGAP